MRAQATALFLLLLAPGVLAQSPLPLVALEIDPFEEPIAPLKAPGSTGLRARVSCALVDQGGRLSVAYAVAEKPSWVVAVVSPVQDVAEVSTCDQGVRTFRATLTVTLDDKAPAFAPSPMLIAVTAGPSGREERAEARVNVTASYFSILDVRVDPPIVQVEPGRAHEFALHVTNFGNGETRVTTTLVQPPPTLRVTLPPPATIGSRQQGAGSSDEILRLVVSAPEEDAAVVNKVESFTVRVAGAYAKDDAFAGDASDASFVVTIRRTPDANGTPLPPVVGAAALVLAALATRRLNASR